MTPLRQRMINAMVLRGLAARTQETYLSAIAQMARHHHRSPSLLSDEQVSPLLGLLAAPSAAVGSFVRVGSTALRQHWNRVANTPRNSP